MSDHPYIKDTLQAMLESKENTAGGSGLFGYSADGRS
jgi:hypothetical protein